MKTKELALMSLMLGLQLVTTRFISIPTPMVRLSFTFVVLAITGSLFGVWKSAAIAIVADLIGATIWPQGAYFWGFTLSAGISGGLYGLLYGKEKTLGWVIGICVANLVFVNLMLNTLWLQIILGKAWNVLIGPRALKALISLPIEIVLSQQAVRIVSKNRPKYLPKY